MDHSKAYETLGSLSASIDWAVREIENSENPVFDGKHHLSSAKRVLKSAQKDYDRFRKDQGWSPLRRDKW